MTRQDAMNDPSIHYIVKNILTMTENKDVVDRYYDVRLVLSILKEEMDSELNH